MEFWKLLACAIVGLLIAYIIEFKNTKKLSKDWGYYGGALLICGVIAAFIKEPVVLGLLMVFIGLSAALVIGVATEIANKKRLSTQVHAFTSMKEAEKTPTLIAAIVSVVILLVVYSMFYFGLFDTYYHAYFKRAPLVANLLSVPIALASIYYAAKYPFEEGMGRTNGVWYGARTFILLALAVAVACGFNFDLRGIE